MNNGVLVIRMISMHRAGHLNCGRQVAVVIKNMKRQNKLKSMRSHRKTADEVVRGTFLHVLPLIYYVANMFTLRVFAFMFAMS